MVLIKLLLSNKTISPPSLVDKGQPDTSQMSLLTHQLWLSYYCNHSHVGNKIL